jgi:LuxR family maltose regulon positive regulatory protein
MRRYPGPPEVAASAAVEPLTAREMAVLRLLAAGMDNRGIAEKMGVAVATVKAHLNHVYAKLGVTGRQEALARAERLGLLR